MHSILLTALLAPAFALPPSADTSDVRQGWIALWEDQVMQARTVASAALAADSGNLQAHRLYIHAWSEDADYLEDQYRTWLSEAPDDAVRSIATAMALHAISDEPGEWCAEAEGLLQVQDASVELQVWMHRVRFDVHTRCEEDTAADLAGLNNLSAQSSLAKTFALTAAIRGGELDAAVVSMMPRVIQEDPWVLTSMARLWWRSAPEGRWADRARRAALRSAKKHVSDEDFAHQYAAWMVLDNAEDPMAAALSLVVDAALERPSAAPSSLEGVGVGAVYDANRAPLPDVAIARLQALSDALPAQGEAREVWEGLMGSRCMQLGQHEEALTHYRQAWQLSPTTSHANDYAWAASVAKQDMDAALQAINAAQEEIFSQTVMDIQSWNSMEGWAEQARYLRANVLDTRGWLLHQLDRDSEALQDLQLAVLLHDDVTFHGHLAHVLYSLSQPQAAFESLVRAALSAGGKLPEADQTLLETLYAEGTGGGWSPAGLDGYVSSRGAGHDDGEEEEPHPLIGHPFPFETYTDIDGEKQPFQTEGDIVVVDFWATWCGPCIQGMPHLQEIAETYAERGVRVMGLSVDEGLEDVQAFLGDGVSLAYTLGWVGEEAFEVGQFPGIPALFVVDGEGIVQSFILGYGRGDTRLEGALDGLLDAQNP